MNMAELYETDADLKRYVDRYCQKYSEGRSIPLDAALRHRIVIEAARQYMEEKENGGGQNDGPYGYSTCTDIASC